MYFIIIHFVQSTESLCFERRKCANFSLSARSFLSCPLEKKSRYSLNGGRIEPKQQPSEKKIKIIFSFSLKQRHKMSQKKIAERIKYLNETRKIHYFIQWQKKDVIVFNFHKFWVFVTFAAFNEIFLWRVVWCLSIWHVPFSHRSEWNLLVVMVVRCAQWDAFALIWQIQVPYFRCVSTKETLVANERKH